MNVCFETFGCRLNRAEALENEAKALALGHKVVTTHADADLIVLRGCSVTARAQRDCEQMIGHLKRKYPNKRLIITGCLPGAEKTLDYERRIATGGHLHSKEISKSATHHSSLIAHNSPPEGSSESAIPNSSFLIPNSFPVPTRTARAYLKVQDGCAGKCTFCIVPKFRGSSVSEPFDAVIAKASKFIEADYHEIVVTGCNLALYASDGKRLPDLLAALAALDPNCRIRLGSLEPWGCADEVVDVVAENANICRFLHLPVQSGANRILTAMQRPYLVEDVERIADKAKKLMPFVSLGCDLIAGFPGESEGDFVQTKNLLLRIGFANAHVFPFSERPGTTAAKLPGLIQKHVRSSRAHTLGSIAQESKKRFARRFIGKDVEIVVESHSMQPKGWTSEYLWFEGPQHSASSIQKNPQRKQLLKFTVRSASDGILHGVPAIRG